MKYHSIIMPMIQKYAGLGFVEKAYFDDTKWFRRAFLICMPNRDPTYRKAEVSAWNF